MEIDYNIVAVEGPLSENIVSELVLLGESNNFYFRDKEFYDSGSIYFFLEVDSKIVATRRFKKHIFANNNAGSDIIAYQCCETLTDKNFRGRGFFGLIWEKAKDYFDGSVDLFFNFPNSYSYKPYLKSGFSLFDQMYTFTVLDNTYFKFNRDEFYFDKKLTTNKSDSLFKISLQGGIYKYLSISSVDYMTKLSEVHLPRFTTFGCNLKALRDVHGIYFVRSIMSNLRPITIFLMNDNIDLDKLYFSPGSYDTAKIYHS